jgi:hypothetical protein
MKILPLTSLLLAVAANAQTTATYSGVIKHLTGNPVISGQVTFTLTPSIDSTISGTTGPLNYSGVPGRPLQFLGAWSSTTSYTLGQAVSYNNAVYISLTNPNANNNPASSTANWSIVVLPGSVLANPSLTQTISQPSGTTFSVNSVNNVLEASQFAGVDIGAKINAAIANRGTSCGTISIAPGSYSFSTQIVKPRCIMIEGNNAVLTWNGSNPNMPAIVTGTAGGGEYTSGGIRNLKLLATEQRPGSTLAEK